MKEIIDSHLKNHLRVVERLQSEQSEIIAKMGEAWIETLRAGGKILFCGNGGSAADAQHLAAELVIRFKREREGLPGLALTVDTSILTAGGNDYGFESVFRRQVEALGKPGDLLVGFSTSGTSANVLRAMETAKRQKLRTMAFCGPGTEGITQIADFVLGVEAEETARIQECHLLVGHILCDLVDITYSEES
jgi:D-sedoheptulose 7-phosphate isomerase